MSEWWEILLMVGAAIRLTRLVVDDSLTMGFRHWVEYKEERSKRGVAVVSFTTLINCSWCAGMWVSALVVGLSVAWSGFYWLWLVASISYIVGLESVLRERVEVE